MRSPSFIEVTTAPAAVLDDVIPEVAQPAHRGTHLVGVLGPQAARVGHLGREHRDDARRLVGALCAAEPLDELSSRARSSCGVGRKRGAQDTGDRGLLVRVDSGVGRRHLRRGSAVEERDGGRGQAVHVCRWRRLLTRRDLGSDVPDRSHRTVARVAGDVEVDEHHSATGALHDVGGLHIAVNDRRIVGVQMVERGGDLREIVDHLLHRKAGVAMVVEHVLQVRAVDPVHHHHVAVIAVGEEVAADDR